jgi:diadenosine tetraphosphate (Ap4A) HIT family hydrolase
MQGVSRIKNVGPQMDCWLCKEKDYRFIKYDKLLVDRLVYEDKYTYAIVPKDSHVKHHLLVVLKSKNGVHKKGLIECNAADLRKIGKTMAILCSKLKKLNSNYDTIYTGCFSDEGHVHYHLFPLNHKNDKGYSGCAITWLSEKEAKSTCKSFKNMSRKEKKERLKEIDLLAKEIKLLFG